MKVETVALFFCLAVVTSQKGVMSQKVDKAELKDMFLKQLLQTSFERSESSGSSGSESGSNGSGGGSSGTGSESDDSGSGSGNGEGSNEFCFGIGKKQKLESISDAINWMNDEYSTTVLEEDFTQLQYVLELIGYLIVVEEHRQYAEDKFLARHLLVRDPATSLKKDTA